ncbi:phage late control D family protein [Veronia pacifica]|uniref:Phage tail protein n=1 Tax=Veronia pacifica TaxID=1080227 RepID=A0A1C3EBM6_9GAMM|nr:contractile injection system protein, VgrG/Pvc8 family [Veronia pacifica]ODA30635.1 hypothetical protein A8L45_19720 [Veronia pacifica]
MAKTHYKVLANGRDISAVLRDRLEQLLVTDRAGLAADTVMLALDNRDDKIAFPATGAELEIWLGTGDRQSYKGLYQVTELEMPLETRQLIIHATAAPFRDAIKSPRSRTYSDIRFGDLVSQIAAVHGLTPVVSTVLANRHFEHINQQGESDLNLLTRLATQMGAVAKPVAGRLLVTPRGTGQSASGKAMPEHRIDDPAHSRGTLRIAERSEYRAVAGRWFDEKSQRWKQEVAGEGEPLLVLKTGFRSGEDAAEAASSELTLLQRARRHLSLERPLNPALAAEARVRISGHRAAANGQWIIAEATHMITAGGVATTRLQLYEAR